MAVTVTVESVAVLLRDSDKTEPAGDCSVEEVVKVLSEGKGVGGGVVMIDCESVSWDPTTLVTDETPGTVTEPTSSKETIVSAVASGTVVATEVAVPSLTWISTMLAVTVASGALGSRYMPAFLRGNEGLFAASPPTMARLWKSERLMVRVGIA